MSYSVPKFLKRDGDSLLYDGKGEMFIYVPESYFEADVAIEYGNTVSMMGIADYSIENDPDKPVYGKDLKTLNFPSLFMTRPYDMEKVKALSIGNVKERDYRILKYRKGDQVVVSVHVPMIVTNAELFYNLLIITAKMPTTVEYGNIWNYFIRSLKLNGGNYGVNAAMFGLIESEICRDPDDLSKPFVQSKKFEEDKTAYQLLSVKELPRYISPYTAITSENWDESVIAATMNDKEIYSPLEKILMG